jgi:hypothetical protein
LQEIEKGARIRLSTSAAHSKRYIGINLNLNRERARVWKSYVANAANEPNQKYYYYYSLGAEIGGKQPNTEREAQNLGGKNREQLHENHPKSAGIPPADFYYPEASSIDRAEPRIIAP